MNIKLSLSDDERTLLKNIIKEVIKETRAEKSRKNYHSELHCEIMARLRQGAKPGRYYMDECFLCGKFIEYKINWSFD